MSQDNAAQAQYETPTPVCSVGCLVPPPGRSPGQDLPRTGFDVGVVLCAGVALIALGTWARRFM